MMSVDADGSISYEQMKVNRTIAAVVWGVVLLIFFLGAGKVFSPWMLELIGSDSRFNEMGKVIMVVLFGAVAVCCLLCGIVCAFLGFREGVDLGSRALQSTVCRYAVTGSGKCVTIYNVIAVLLTGYVAISFALLAVALDVPDVIVILLRATRHWAAMWLVCAWCLWQVCLVIRSVFGDIFRSGSQGVALLATLTRGENIYTSTIYLWIGIYVCGAAFFSTGLVAHGAMELQGVLYLPTYFHSVKPAITVILKIMGFWGAGFIAGIIYTLVQLQQGYLVEVRR